MVYCPPFNRLFGELGRIVGGVGFPSLVGKERVVGGTPLVDATTEFLREFVMEDGRKEVGDGGHGKGKEVDKHGRGEGEEEKARDAFLPSRVYDAMKEKKRFDTMRVRLLGIY
jgi:ubiquitin carboxyl-terminal hydrolase 10